MNRKSIIIYVAIICILIAILCIVNTFAIFESNVSGEIEVQNAKWIIHINNTDITKGTNKNFIIDKIEIEQNSRTEEGKIAPGLSGKFDIEIDPSGTDVSVRYDIEFDLSKLNGTKLQINSIKETEKGDSFVKTGEDKYTGIISLSDIKNGVKHNISVEFNWEEDETTNEEDSKIGVVPNNTISIPVSIKVSQYLGEKVEEYVE